MQLASFLLHCHLGEELLAGVGIGAVRKDKDVDRLFERRPLSVLTGGK